jgi:phage terminase Nu1 subunit (DNA packaging protein)
MSRPQVVPAASPVIPIGQILVDKAGLAKAFAVSQRTVDYWREKGIIPFLSFGDRFIRFDIAEVRNAVEKYKIRAKAKGKEAK